MKNWKTLDADINRIMNKHFTKGRGGNKIDKVVIHYNYGDLTVEGCWQTWQTREASAHYQVQSDGIIGQLVWDSDTAWHAGNWEANQTSIGIEHANVDGGRVTEACLDNGAHLVAAICNYFKLGNPCWGKNMFPHKHFSSTSCPGELYGQQKAEYEKRANYWYEKMLGFTPQEPTVNPQEPKADIEQLARDVINGKYGNGQARKDGLGYNYETVQARVNEILSGTPRKRVDIDQLARDVIDGKYGNGQERKQRLGSLYNQVQKRVNEMLGA